MPDAGNWIDADPCSIFPSSASDLMRDGGSPMVSRIVNTRKKLIRGVATWFSPTSGSISRLKVVFTRCIVVLSKARC